MPEPTAARKKRRGEDATRAVREHAERLGFLEPLRDACVPEGASTGNAAAAKLERALLDDSALAWDTPRLATALVWLERFMAHSEHTFVVPGRTGREGLLGGRGTDAHSTC